MCHSVLPPRVSAYRRFCIQGFCIQGVCIQGEELGRPPWSACGGVCLQGGFADPLESEKRVVCIQVECFLVFQDVYTRIFHKRTKLVILALLPTLFAHIFAVFFLLATYYVSKYEIRYQ